MMDEKFLDGELNRALLVADALMRAAPAMLFVRSPCQCMQQAFSLLSLLSDKKKRQP